MRKIIINCWPGFINPWRRKNLQLFAFCFLLLLTSHMTVRAVTTDSERIEGLASTAKQQGISISGTVIGDDGLTLPGVTILEKGTNNGTITDASGNFKLTVSSTDAVLSVSYIGYLTEERPVGLETNFKISLVSDLQRLDEVVVIGYGTQKKKLSTGATVHVDNEEITNKHSLRVEQSIQGLTPGVQVTANSGQPGENPKVRIRGVGTVGNSNPLYVVDGVPTDNILFLNPSDVESVDVLKDAASAAIYGARAANGVILITTKKGTPGEMRVTYDGYYGVQNVIKKMDLLNGQEYMMIRNEARKNSGSSALYSEADINSIGEGTDWQEYLFNKNAPTYTSSIGISGGSEKSIYSSSISYSKQYGIVGEPSKSNYERISARLNSEHKVHKNLKVGENLVYTHSNKRGVGVGDIWGAHNIVRNFLNASPVYPVYDSNRPDGFAVSPHDSVKEANPYALMYYSDYSWLKKDDILGKVFAEITFLKDFKFTTSYGIDLSYSYKNIYEPTYYLTPTINNPSTKATMEMGRDFTYDFENYLTYNKTFGKHNIMLLAGNTIERYNQYFVGGEKQDLIIPDFDFAILDNGTNDSTQRPYGNKLERALLSYYGRLNYNYNEEILFSATLRADGSSKFGPKNRFGYFPSVSAGWVLTRRDFMQISWLEYLKIRASWGQNGNDKIGDYQYEALISSDPGKAYYFGNDVKFVGSSPLKINNPKIKWETSEQLDIGFDARILKSFSIAFDYYKKSTKDWLIIAPISDIAGNDAPTINGGIVVNKGVELDLGYKKMEGEFTYSINANVAYNKNEVTKIDNEDGVIQGPGPDGTPRHVIYNQSTEVYRAQEGYPIGYFIGYEMDGIFQTQDEIDNYIFINTAGDTSKIQGNAKPGDIKFIDRNHDGRINEDDRTMIGDPNPDYTFGLSFDAQYKGFDFSIFLQGVAGNQILLGTRNYNEDYSNYTTDVLDRWHWVDLNNNGEIDAGEGTSNSFPRVTSGNNNNYLNTTAEMFIRDGSYLKIRSINIGYDFKKLLKKFPVQKLRLYFSANNLYTFTKYPGLDPEVGYGDYDADRYNNFSTGIDIGYYPIPRSYLIGLNVEF